MSIEISLHPDDQPTEFRLYEGLVTFRLELRNTGRSPIELPEPERWDTDLPEELNHSSDSQGLLHVRRVRELNPGDRRYSCTESDYEPTIFVLQPGERREFTVCAHELAGFPPGEYEAHVELYQPRITSDPIRFNVDGATGPS